MVDKDKEHDKDKHEREREHDKREHEKREHEKREQRAGQPGPFANVDQDPDHPANRTQPKDTRPGAERDHIEGPVYASKNLMTEQEKDAGGESMGVGPMAQSEATSGPVETMEDQGIGPRTPYPTGSPPPPAESNTFAQGIKGVTDKPSAKPNSSTGPAGRSPALGDRDEAYRADHKDDKPKPQPGPMQTQRSGL
jgi:hypothetical protein